MLVRGITTAVIVQEAERMHRQILETGIKHKCPSATAILFLVPSTGALESNRNEAEPRKIV